MKGIGEMYDVDISVSDKTALVAALFSTEARPYIRFDPNRDGIGLGRWVVFSAKDSDVWLVHTETLPEAVGICHGEFTIVRD